MNQKNSVDNASTLPQPPLLRCCGLLVVTALLMTAGCYACARTANQPHPSGVDRTVVRDAIFMAQYEYVAPRLWQPQSAQFADVPHESVRCAPPRYTVSGTLTAIDRGGRRVPYSYECVVEQHQGDRWKVIRCAIDPPYK